MTTSLSSKITTDRNEWSFVSGRISALEAELLPRSFFEGLLKSKTRAEARAALGKSSYRVHFPDDKSLDAASSIIDVMAREIKAELFAVCPVHPLENFFTIGDRFRTFRTLFNQACRHSNPPVAELENFFRLFMVEPEYAVGLREHASLLARSNPPQAATAMERSLYLDSAACSLMFIVSEFVPEPLVRQYMRDRAFLSAWSGIFRLRWNGVPADLIRRWFVFENALELAGSVLSMENDPKAIISARLSTLSSNVMETIDIPRIKNDIDGVAADILRETVMDCRRVVPFGPERVVSYLVALEAELINLELCLSTVANNIDREVTQSRLRRDYA